MKLREIESAVSSLSPDGLAQFQRWFDEYLADAWDARIENDINVGRLNHLAAEADREFDAGRCTQL